MKATTRELLLRVIGGCLEGTGVKAKYVFDHIEPVIEEQELAAMREAIEAKKAPCIWTQEDDEDCNAWETSCNETFVLEEGTPKENSIKFCAFCGHPVIEKAYEPPNWEDEE